MRNRKNRNNGKQKNKRNSKNPRVESRTIKGKQKHRRKWRRKCSNFGTKREDWSSASNSEFVDSDDEDDDDDDDDDDEEDRDSEDDPTA